MPDSHSTTDDAMLERRINDALVLVDVAPDTLRRWLLRGAADLREGRRGTPYAEFLLAGERVALEIRWQYYSDLVAAKYPALHASGWDRERAGEELRRKLIAIAEDDGVVESGADIG